MNTTTENNKPSLNFIEAMIEEDIKNGKNDGRVHTRFPPEPNGYLHIGHAKSICLNFSIAQKYNGKCNLRFDDTNPIKEDVEYVDSIMEDIRWLGFEWEGEPHYASDYFEQLYQWAEKMIQDGKAYVDEQTSEKIASQKGTPTVPGQKSPFRNRPEEENLKLFRQMKNGDFKDGEMILRAKGDMSSSNMHMRDPIMYRIIHKEHHRTGNKWCIYPMYDFTHGQSDYIEGITHSLCTLEFENHRPLYNWYLQQLVNTEYKPQQTEFARLNMSYTVMSKRKLLQLVQDKHVSGWDDPRMPTLSGMRRRGYTPEAIKTFAERIGIAKRDNVIDLSLLEFCVREDLNKKANRLMVVLNPIKLIIENYPESKQEWLSVENNPEDEKAGARKMPFGREIYIEKQDFMEVAPRKFFRLSIGKEVRLKGAYIIKAEKVIKDNEGNISEIICTYDPDTKSGSGTEASKRKVKGTLHWVDAKQAIPVKVNLYDRLFNHEDPASEDDFVSLLNPNSLQILENCMAEPDIKNLKPLDTVQFQRQGYFCLDKNSNENNIIFNRTTTLKDSWTKKQK